MYKTNGQTAVTNDGAKIVAELLVKHPAAKAFVQLAESQENACGDGVTGCIIVASELMREAGRLLEKGLHPLVLVEGYQRALQTTLDTLDASRRTASKPTDNERLHRRGSHSNDGDDRRVRKRPSCPMHRHRCPNSGY